MSFKRFASQHELSNCILFLRCGGVVWGGSNLWQERAVNEVAQPVMFEIEAKRQKKDSMLSTYDSKLQYDQLVVFRNESRICQFFDEGLSAWSGRGCTTRKQLDNKIFCACTHLTTFSGAFENTFGSLGSNQGYTGIWGH